MGGSALSLQYRLLYRIGLKPWDSETVETALKRVVEGSDAMPPGRALDVGCGTGTQAVYLAMKGWQVTAVDAVERALSAARERGRRARIEVHWRRGDVTRLDELGLEPGFDLMHDRGCYHGLNDHQRERYAHGLSRMARSGTTLLLFAFQPGLPRLFPQGTTESELKARLAGWELVETGRYGGSRWIERRGAATWYRFRRSE